MDACRNVDALKAVDPQHIAHVLNEHYDHRQNCPFGVCQWNQRAIISSDHKKEIHLHGHFYHRVAIDDDDDEETENERELIEYQSIPDDVNQSILHFGVKLNSSNWRDAKFRDLESEMMENGHYRLEQDQWRQLLRLCVILSTSGRAKEMGLSVNEMVAIKLFLDFPDLRRSLKRCFHDNDPQQRSDFQRTFYHWISLMSSAVNKSRDEIGNKLYLPISYDFPLNQMTMYQMTCCGPIVLCTDFETAFSRNPTANTILEVYAPFTEHGLDISWLSSFPDAQRVLYIDATFQISDIHCSSMSQPINIDSFAFNHNFSVSKLMEMDNDLAIAISRIDTSQPGALSLNIDRGGYFKRLSAEEMYSVLLLLSLQFNRKIWNQIKQILNGDLMDQRIKLKLRGILYLRDHVTGLMETVRSVEMDDMPSSLKKFFVSGQDLQIISAISEEVEDCIFLDLVPQVFPTANRLVRIPTLLNVH